MTDQLTRIENDSIRTFVKHAADEGYLSGRVLDYGCGRQPYRDIVEYHGGEYTGYDRDMYAANLGAGNVGPDFPLLYIRHWNAVLMNQVAQYIEPVRSTNDYGTTHLRDGLYDILAQAKVAIELGGHLVMTYPTNWPEVQEFDVRRYTKAGMAQLLSEAGFTIIEHIDRFPMRMVENIGGPVLAYVYAGHGVIARA